MLLHAATILLSAFLLFLLQPIIARQILPWFGGSAVVWATCLVFFQSTLLAGYAYSDFVIRKCRPSGQLLIHGALLAVSLAWLPIVPAAHWKPVGSGEPVGPILGLLAATVGLPYLALSTTSPMVQAWYWQRHATRVPYRLFALSNAASLLALLAYPTAIEPWVSTRGQTLGWSALYVVFAALSGLTGWVSLRGGGAAAAAARDARESPPASGEGTGPGSGQRPVTWRERVTWMALSAAGSCLLLAVTSHITQNVAAVPFLWVLPLALYLLSFILAFDHPRWYVRPLFLAALAALVPAMAFQLDALDLKLVIPLYTAGLFVGCMFCHGEIVRSKPEPQHLTIFYLMISLGGAAGSLLVGVVAPLTLPAYQELGFVLVALGALAVVRLWPLSILLSLAAAVITVTSGVAVRNEMREFSAHARVLERNFYGVVRTRDFDHPAPFRAMFHGSIMHGGQLKESDARRTATTYFGPTSGYGRLFASLPPGRPRRIGVIGLGAGALAAYCRAEDQIVFYELDPQVVDVARREFTFLDDAPGTVEIVLGDGRLSLEREPPRGYDVLAIDAFSGDSIPLHLLTREAMEVYQRHLRPDGAIVFQATNRFIDIAPVVQRLADEAGLTAVMISDLREHGEGRDFWQYPTEQIVVTRNRMLIQAKPLQEAARPIESSPGFPLFTDDYTNLFRILK